MEGGVDMNGWCAAEVGVDYLRRGKVFMRIDVRAHLDRNAQSLLGLREL